MLGFVSFSSAVSISLHLLCSDKPKTVLQEWYHHWRERRQTPIC